MIDNPYNLIEESYVLLHSIEEYQTNALLHLWRFKTPILNQRKKIQKYKINSQGLPPCLWFHFILAFAW